MLWSGPALWHHGDVGVGGFGAASSGTTCPILRVSMSFLKPVRAQHTNVQPELVSQNARPRGQGGGGGGGKLGVTHGILRKVPDGTTCATRPFVEAPRKALGCAFQSSSHSSVCAAVPQFLYSGACLEVWATLQLNLHGVSWPLASSR